MNALQRLRGSLRELGAAIAFALLLLVLAIAAPHFFAPSNLRDLAIANAPVQIIAIGMTLVLLAGHVDISVGSQFAVVSVLFAVLSREGIAAPAAIPLVLLAGTAMGVLNGWLVARLSLPSVVVSLATMVIWRDAVRWGTQGAWIQGLPASFQWFGLSQAAGELLLVGLTVALVMAAAYTLTRVAMGRWLYAVGSNAEAARLSGLRPRLVVMAAFASLGGLTALAAVLNAVRFSQVQPNTGTGLELKVLAAVVVGGTLITGGRGRVLGTVAGVALLGTLGTGLTFLGINPFWEKAAQGGIILVAAALDALPDRRARSRVAAA